MHGTVAGKLAVAGTHKSVVQMSAPGAYDIDIEADDINVIDTATVIWEIA
ncbi:hypothetical protein LKD73_13875 [Fusicatenibacter sp. CLA-AA-H241]|nr:hypothetical protein [Oliverpabstia intestinalis]